MKMTSPQYYDCTDGFIFKLNLVHVATTTARMDSVIMGSMYDVF